MPYGTEPGGDTLTASLGRFVAALRFDGLPAEGVSRGTASILDAVGCIVAGTVSEGATPVRTVLAADGGSPDRSRLDSPDP